MEIESIRNKIHNIRGFQVMLDRDLSEFYDVPTKILNRAVKRNIERFPKKFMFQLTTKEVEVLRFQSGTSSLRHGGRRYLPYVFTEQGVAMLAGVLRSDRAIEISIQIIDAFVAMRRFISKNAELFSRLDSVERKQIEHDNKFEQVFNLVEDREPKPRKGIFFDGQIFDAYKFVSDLVRDAKASIILIDNFVDESVLTLFSKRKRGVKVLIYTKPSKQLLLDLKKFNSQYETVEIKEFTRLHDRFMIIDNQEVYHIGASLKDLGKRWFAFSRFEKAALKLLDRLEP